MVKSIYYIEWLDAHSASEWHQDDEIDEFISGGGLVAEVGWIIRETKEVLVMCGQRFIDQPTYGNLTSIPKPWIRKRIKLK